MKKFITISLLFSTSIFSMGKPQNFAEIFKRAIVKDLRVEEIEGGFYCKLCPPHSIDYKDEINLKFHLENSHCVCTACGRNLSYASDVRKRCMECIEAHLTKNLLKKKHENPLYKN